jgi:hypothetical protein
MSRKRRVKLVRWRSMSVAAWLLCMPLHAQAGGHFDFDHEDDDTGWSVSIDNDLFFPVSRDQQYTGGMALTLAGKRAAEYWYSLDPFLETLNNWSGFSSLYDDSPHYRLHSISFGIEAFTPENIRTSTPIYNDRPYANLIMLSNTQLNANLQTQVIYHSNFTLGIIGSKIGEDVQKTLHRILGNEVPQGWGNQISNGGELTAMYTLTRQKLHIVSKTNDGLTGELRSVLGGSVGTTTEVGFGVGGRFGRITTPWWEFAPVFGDYLNLGTPFASRPHSRAKELFFWGGLIARYRFYNALLQGQFRESEVAYGADELIPLVTETAVGVTWEPVKLWTLSLSLRVRSSEFKNTTGMNTNWGSLTLSYCH